MKLTNRFKKALIIGMAITSTVSTVYAVPSTTTIGADTQFSVLPQIFGADDIVIQVGTPYNILTGITAVDQYGEDITDSIVIKGGYLDRSTCGQYQVMYEVTDSQGLKGFARRNITVADNMQPEQDAAVFSGVEDINIPVGGSFNRFAGVTVVDPIDGDITAKMHANEYIQSGTPGTYMVQYSVTNSRGYRSSYNRLVTVIDAEAYDPNKIYNEGDRVLYDGKIYVAQWWTRGDVPGQSEVWRLEDQSIIEEYVYGREYQTGDLVRYNGDTYKANWWTSSVPGTDNSWSLV